MERNDLVNNITDIIINYAYNGGYLDTSILNNDIGIILGNYLDENNFDVDRIVSDIVSMINVPLENESEFTNSLYELLEVYAGISGYKSSYLTIPFSSYLASSYQDISLPSDRGGREILSDIAAGRLDYNQLTVADLKSLIKEAYREIYAKVKNFRK